MESFVSSTLLLLLFLQLGGASAATLNMVNQCSYTIWPAYLIPGVASGGEALGPGGTWSVGAPSSSGRVWGRTGCNFDGSGHGGCSSGDCGGVINCGGSGSATATLFEFEINGAYSLDYYDISLVDAFNLGMKVVPSNGACASLDCPASGCSDAYPKQPTCPTGTTDYTIYFCA